MRTNWIARRVLILVSSLAPLFRHAGRGVVVAVVIGCRRSVARGFSCCRRLALPCLLRASRADAFPCSSVVSACYPFRPFCPIVVSLGSPQLDKCGGANTGCVSVWVRLGRCCLLLAVAGPLMWLGRFLSWVLLVVAVSMASAVCVIYVVPVACFALVVMG